MDICFLLETRRPPRPNEVIVACGELLEQRGARVKMVYPEQQLWRLDQLKVEADLYLLKSDSELTLSLGHALELMGAKVLNSFDACRKAKDKTIAAGLLFGAGIPTPASHAANCASQFETELASGPIILKPNRGYHGVGLSVVENGTQLSQAPEYSDTIFAHQYLKTARKDLKLFGIGDDVFAVRKAFSADSFTKAGEASALSSEHEDIARRCAEAFGLRLYGIDIAETDDGPSVVDVNYFPGYRGVPDAAGKLANLIWQHAKGTI